jgi:hypothetical protein
MHQLLKIAWGACLDDVHCEPRAISAAACLVFRRDVHNCATLHMVCRGALRKHATPQFIANMGTSLIVLQ